MTTLFRPVHAGFDAKRPAAMTARTSGGYHHFGNLADVSQTARFLRPTRPQGPFAEICAR
jgi:hypothetical protein